MNVRPFPAIKERPQGLSQPQLVARSGRRWDVRVDGTKIAWVALVSSVSLCGCIVDHDLIVRSRPAVERALPPEAAPGPARAAPPTAAPRAWNNPYLVSEAEAAEMESDAGSAKDDAAAAVPPPDLAPGEEGAPSAPMTAAEAAALLADDVSDDEAGPPPPPGDATAPDAPAGAPLVPVTPLATLAADEVPPPGAEVDPKAFESRLAAYGRWVETPEYGRVWIPAGVASDWRPYWNGRWVYTSWGWTFASDDPWGWAAWHYGRWGFGVGFGWYWIPGGIWSPAWVSWRWGHGWACWAPYGSRWSDRSPAWVVVRGHHFTRPIAGVALRPGAGVRAIAAARPLPPLAGRPVAGTHAGPPRREVEASLGHTIAQRSVAVALRPRPLASRAGAGTGGSRGWGSGAGGVSAGPVARPSSGPAGSAGAPSQGPAAGGKGAPARPSVRPPRRGGGARNLAPYPGELRPSPRLEPGGSAVAGRVRPQVARPPGGARQHPTGGGRPAGGARPATGAHPSGGAHPAKTHGQAK